MLWCASISVVRVDTKLIHFDLIPAHSFEIEWLPITYVHSSELRRLMNAT